MVSGDDTGIGQRLNSMHLTKQGVRHKLYMWWYSVAGYDMATVPPHGKHFLYYTKGIDYLLWINIETFYTK